MCLDQSYVLDQSSHVCLVLRPKFSYVPVLDQSYHVCPSLQRLSRVYVVCLQACRCGCRNDATIMTAIIIIIIIKSVHSKVIHIRQTLSCVSAVCLQACRCR